MTETHLIDLYYLICDRETASDLAYSQVTNRVSIIIIIIVNSVSNGMMRLFVTGGIPIIPWRSLLQHLIPQPVNTYPHYNQMPKEREIT